MKLEIAEKAKQLIEELQQTKENREALFDRMRIILKKYNLNDDMDFSAISICMSHTFDKLITNIENEIYKLKD